MPSNPCGISPDRTSGGAALLRRHDKTRARLAFMNTGLRQIPLERRRSRHSDSAPIVQLESDLPRGSERTQRPRSLTRAATSARAQPPRAALIDLVFERPPVSSDMIAEALGVTLRAGKAHHVEDGTPSLRLEPFCPAAAPWQCWGQGGLVGDRRLLDRQMSRRHRRGPSES
jgi:hypothetical protein